MELNLSSVMQQSVTKGGKDAQARNTRPHTNHSLHDLKQ